MRFKAGHVVSGLFVAKKNPLAIFLLTIHFISFRKTSGEYAEESVPFPIPPNKNASAEFDATLPKRLPFRIARRYIINYPLFQRPVQL
jgi:hypothetical protein